MVKQCYDKLEGEAVSYELLLSTLLGVWSRPYFGDRVCVIVLACTFCYFYF